MLKRSFTSRGYNYHLCKDLAEFCDVYYPDHNMQDEYIESCCRGEWANESAWWTQKDDVYYFYIPPQSDLEDVYLSILHGHMTTEFGYDMTLLEAMESATIIAENLFELNTMKFNANLV